METPLFQVFQQTGQSGDGCRVNVVEQQNAFAVRLKALHRKRNYFLRRDTVMPIIRHRVGAKVNKYPSCKLTLDNFRARQSRNTETFSERYNKQDAGAIANMFTKDAVRVRNCSIRSEWRNLINYRASLPVQYDESRSRTVF